MNSGGAGPVSAEWMVPKALWLCQEEPGTYKVGAVWLCMRWGVISTCTYDAAAAWCISSACGTAALWPLAGAAFGIMRHHQMLHM